jgi:hypothetical protein
MQFVYSEPEGCGFENVSSSRTRAIVGEWRGGSPRDSFMQQICGAISMDPNNPVVKLCAEGMRAEGAGRFDDARDLFMKAWEMSVDDYDACIAAHYVARHQASAEETLRWNRIAADRADAVKDDRVAGFYPSLYLNLGHSHEQLGDMAEARRFYELAAAKGDSLPDGRYGDVVRRGAEEGLRRIG